MSSGPGQVARLGRAQEAVAVGHDLEHALREEQAVPLGLRLQHAEDEVVLPEPAASARPASSAASVSCWIVISLRREISSGGTGRRPGSARGCRRARLARRRPRQRLDRQRPCRCRPEGAFSVVVERRPASGGREGRAPDRVPELVDAGAALGAHAEHGLRAVRRCRGRAPGSGACASPWPRASILLAATRYGHPVVLEPGAQRRGRARWARVARPR